MFSRDYLVRLIEDMTSVLGKAMGLRQENKLTEAEWEIDDLFQRRFRLSGPLIHSLSPEDLITMFTFNGVLESDRVQGVALLLKEQALIDEAKNDPAQATVRRMKALHLLAYASVHGAPVKWIQTHDEMNQLIELLQGKGMAVSLHQVLWTYYESVGNYAKAEDHLFYIRDRQIDVTEEGIAFYHRLLEQTDEALEKGGLPRGEVLQGLSQLQQHREV
ncbi:hypothetical protein BVG16_24665 [Paenibacillus selenitireducens]|uniref:Uncharacterized protein n=1 Tax=Paenibacillus selenitireducens TaxID=1324314 RepID=A0A1T2X380_9BACL|nr:DUF6483 family protein [Paenibacillus selenitireducens]OPA74319.1 hypothetical protein BVG16_24665 [Paenibacillus selenitireducens]